MFADAFEFDGILSSNLGYYIMSYGNGVENGARDLGGEIEFITSQPGASDTWNFHGSKADSPLTFTFQIIKYDCNDINNYALSRAECAFLQEWLVRRDGYKWLRFFDDKGEYNKTYFKAQINLKFIEHNGEKIGAELSVTCNAPYGFSDLQEIDTEDTDTLNVYNDTDKLGAIIIDEVNLTCSDSTVSITNNLERGYTGKDVSTVIKHCSPFEKITIKDRMITTTYESHKDTIARDFNYEYPRLIYYYDDSYRQQRENIFTLKGVQKIQMYYRTVRTVVM